MYILIILSYILTGCIGVFLYIQLKEKEDDIEELYNLFYERENQERNKKKKGKIIDYDRRIY